MGENRRRIDCSCRRDEARKRVTSTRRRAVVVVVGCGPSAPARRRAQLEEPDAELCASAARSPTQGRRRRNDDHQRVEHIFNEGRLGSGAPHGAGALSVTAPSSSGFKILSAARLMDKLKSDQECSEGIVGTRMQTKSHGRRGNDRECRRRHHHWDCVLDMRVLPRGLRRTCFF